MFEVRLREHQLRDNQAERFGRAQIGRLPPETKKIEIAIAHTRSLRPWATFVGRRREDRQICVAAHERVEGNLAIPDDCKLAAQKTWRGTVLRGRRDGVNNPDASTGLERRREIIEQAVRLRDFVIHVHEDCGVKRMGGQPRIVWLPEADGDVLQSEITQPIAQAPQIFWPYILRNYAPIGSDDRRQPHDVVAAACADIRDGHPGLDAEELHELAWFAGGVPLLFAMPDRADHFHHRQWDHDELQCRENIAPQPADLALCVGPRSVAIWSLIKVKADLVRMALFGRF